MSVLPTSIALQMQFAGPGGAWTDVWADVRMSVAPKVSYGISGNGPDDRIASTGTLTFALDNSTGNSGAVVGYYSPGHGSARSGFELGIGVRLAIVYSGTTYYKFRGILEDVQPAHGTLGERIVVCRAVDWMDETAKRPTRAVATQVGQRADQIIATLQATLTFQPASTSLATASFEFPYAVDTARDGRTAIMTEMAKAAQSDLGFLFMKGDTSAGGVLRYQDRRVRQNAGAALSTLSNIQHDLDVGRHRQLIYNRVEVTIHPRRVDSEATTVLYQLDSESLPSIPPGESITIQGSYSDPALRASQVGGMDMVTPEATTDYVFGTGPGDDSLTADLGVTATYSSNSVTYLLENNASQWGVVTHLQARGRGIYDYAPLMLLAEDQTSKDAYGEYVLAVDLPHEVSAVFGQSAANYFLSKYKDPRYLVDSVGFYANISAALMTAALAREPGDAIELTETVSSLSSAPHFIQRVGLTVLPAMNIYCDWGLAPRFDTGTYWILDTADDLDTDTIIGL